MYAVVSEQLNLMYQYGTGFSDSAYIQVFDFILLVDQGFRGSLIPYTQIGLYPKIYGTSV